MRFISYRMTDEKDDTMKFSNRMTHLEASVFTKLNITKLAHVRAGKEVYDFTIGSPNTAPSQEVQDAFIKAAKDPKSYMYAMQDTKDFRMTIQTWYKTRYKVELDDQSEILSLQGSQEGLAHIALTLCDTKDIVLIPSPSYPIFVNGPHIAGASVYEMPMKKEHDYLIQLDKIPINIARKAKMMMISYPNNPTGAIAPDCFYEEVIRFAKENDVVVVHDTAYSNFVFDGEEGKSFLSYEGAKEIGVEFNSFSKTYGMAGARIGICVGNAQIVEKLRLLKSNMDYGMFLPIQRAAIAALTQDQSCVKELCAMYQRRRDILVKGLREAGWYIEPCKSTMFLWAQIPSGYKNSEAFVVALLEETGMFITPGSAFGKQGEGFVRIALVNEEAILFKAIERVKESNFFKK